MEKHSSAKLIAFKLKTLDLTHTCISSTQICMLVRKIISKCFTYHKWTCEKCIWLKTETKLLKKWKIASNKKNIKYLLHCANKLIDINLFSSEIKIIKTNTGVYRIKLIVYHPIPNLCIYSY